MAKVTTNRGEYTRQFPNIDGTDSMSMLSYKSIYALRNMFRTAGGHYDQFNGYEMPGTVFFRLFFYFDNHCYVDGDGINASNFLSTDIDTGLFESSNLDPRYNDELKNHTFANSALNYLLINNEYERAELLLRFISLLASINTYSPWYFASIDGLQEAVERKEFSGEGAFKIEDTRRVLSIKCLPDAMDMRIGTLLDLYREICYSYTLKKEIVPANLRKFDVGLYIFNTPLYGISHNKYDENGSIKENYADFDLKWKNENYRTSAKYLEFHNCEIDPNSSKSAYDSINNAEGKQNEYTISLWYDSCYERRYNEFLMREIGDAVFADLNQSASGDEIAEHLQGNISISSNIELSSDDSVRNIQQIHQQQLKDRSLPRLSTFNITGSQGNSSSKREELTNNGLLNIHYGIETSKIPSKRYNKGWLQSNIEGAVGGLMDSTMDKVSSLMLGNIYTGEGVNNWLSNAERNIKNVTSGSTTRSTIASLF